MEWTDIITEPACFDKRDIYDMEWAAIINEDIGPDEHVTDAETKNTASGTQTMDSLTSSQDLQDRLSEVFVSGCYADEISAEEDNGSQGSWDSETFWREYENNRVSWCNPRPT